MQKMITGLEVVIIRQVQRLKDMNDIIKGLKYTIQELQQNAAGKKNDGLETVVMDKERQIQDTDVLLKEQRIGEAYILGPNIRGNKKTDKLNANRKPAYSDRNHSNDLVHIAATKVHAQPGDIEKAGAQEQFDSNEKISLVVSGIRLGEGKKTKWFGILEKDRY